MSRKVNLFWLTYFYFFFIFSIAQASAFLGVDSPSQFYYAVLYSFNDIFALEYFFNVTQILLNMVHLVPLYLFIYKKWTSNQELLKFLLFFRILFDIVGHAWETNFLAGIYQLNPYLCWTLLAGFGLLYLPSYYACYVYAFKVHNKKAK